MSWSVFFWCSDAYASDARSENRSGASANARSGFCSDALSAGARSGFCSDVLTADTTLPVRLQRPFVLSLHRRHGTLALTRSGGRLPVLAPKSFFPDLRRQHFPLPLSLSLSLSHGLLHALNHLVNKHVGIDLSNLSPVNLFPGNPGLTLQALVFMTAMVTI